MWIHLLSKQEELTERSKRRIIFKLGEDIIGLSILTLADGLASNEENIDINKTINEILEYFYVSRKKIKQILMGRDLIKHLHLQPGEYFGEILSIVQTAYEEGKIRTKKDALKLASDIAKEKKLI